MKTREGDYLRFARDLRIPFTNNAAEQAIRMSKLRIKSPAACAPWPEPRNSARSAATSPRPAARHGIGALDALTTAFQGQPWIPETG